MALEIGYYYPKEVFLNDPDHALYTYYDYDKYEWLHGSEVKRHNLIIAESENIIFEPGSEMLDFEEALKVWRNQIPKTFKKAENRRGGTVTPLIVAVGTSVPMFSDRIV